MKISVLRPSELEPSQRRAWASFQAANPALKSPYFNVEFALAAGEVRPDARVAVIETDGKLSGFFPFQKRAGGVGFPVAGPFTDWEGPIAAQGISFCPVALVRGCGLLAYDFENIPAQPAFAPFAKRRDGSHIVDLTNGFDAYIAQRRASGSTTFNMSSTKHRRLESAHGPVRFEYDESSPDVFKQMLLWKSKQYRESRHIDAFQFRWATSLLEYILAQKSDDFSGVMSALYVGDALLAVHVGMRSKKVLHYWFPAYNVEFSRFSPGTILFYEMAREAANRGLEMMDLGKGTYEFKHNVATYQVPLLEGSVMLPSVLTTLRAVESWSTRHFEALPIGALASVPRRGMRRLRRELAFR